VLHTELRGLAVSEFFFFCDAMKLHTAACLLAILFFYTPLSAAQTEEAERGLAEDQRRDRPRRGGDEVAHEVRQEVARDHPARTRPHEHRGGGEVLLAQREQLRTHCPGKARPVDEAEDDGDAEEHPDRAPGHRERGGERHPQGQLGGRADDLDEPLDQAVDPAAVVAPPIAAAPSKRLMDRFSFARSGRFRMLALLEPKARPS